LRGSDSDEQVSDFERSEKSLQSARGFVILVIMKGGTEMNINELPRNEEGKIVLPKETQIEMMQFFLRTSIPRKKTNAGRTEKARRKNALA